MQSLIFSELFLIFTFFPLILSSNVESFKDVSLKSIVSLCLSSHFMNSCATCSLLLFTRIDLFRFKSRRSSLYDVLHLLYQQNLSRTFDLSASFLPLYPFASRYLLSSELSGNEGP